ncbi:MAG: DUF4214 domain-containing protein [Acidobacteria bacterium]|nr:DUF4214 domain-containing protein [Acidobacteriota bacterium]
MRKLIIAVLFVAFSAAGALGQSQSAPTLRIVSENGNTLPSELLYGNTKVKPLRLRPGTNQPITIDDSDFFVQQQYVDFLSRFPDQSGFGFWNNEIVVCGTNAGCIDNKRVNVSAAFFLSIEFQQTGYLVYRLNKAAFGNLPGKPVPVVRASFMPDTRQIGQGVVVGTPGADALLEANKVSFINGFVTRPQFTNLYPQGMAAATYVDTLFAKAGVTPTATERQNAITAYGAGDNAGRAAALRSVAESQTLQQVESNKAFVLMQYFGYLQRDPDAAPDNNFDGYNFWLGKLNEFNGNFVNAEMVRAFIVSGEYRGRF